MAGHTIATLWFSLSLAMQFFFQGHLFGWSHHCYLIGFFISGCQQVFVRVISLAGHIIATFWFSLSLAVSRFFSGSSLWLVIPLLPYGCLFLWLSAGFFSVSSLWLVTPLLPYGFLYLWPSAGFCQGHLFGWSHHCCLMVFIISGCSCILFTLFHHKVNPV